MRFRRAGVQGSLAISGLLFRNSNGSRYKESRRGLRVFGV